MPPNAQGDIQNAPNDTHPDRWPVIAILMLVLAGAGFLRFTGLDIEGRWGDEYQQTRSYDLPLTYPHYVVLAAKQQQQPPGDYLIGWLLSKLHRSDWMRRVPAALFGILGVALCFVLTRRMFAPWEGLIAACLVAVSPLHWALSREARPYTIATAAMLVTLIAMGRALSQPTRRRLITFGVAAYLFTLTRSLLPMVVLLAAGVLLTLVWISSALHTKRQYELAWANGAIRRVWFVTLLVAFAAVPMFFFLLSDDAYTILTPAGRANEVALGGAMPERFAENVRIWARMPRGILGDPIVLAFTLLGIVRLWRERKTYLPTTKLILGIMLLSGPLYLLVYSGAVAFHPINPRYGLFLVPILSILAAAGFGELVHRFRRIAPAHAGLRVMASIVAAAVLLASPMHKTFGLTNHFFRQDWRGCAAYLEAKISPNDVVVVFQDLPLGRAQATFWGKYDWPVSAAKPLAESVWSLACSESHWQRLAKQDGQVYIVIRREVQAGPKDAYLTTGLAEAPSGTTLRKFRGLDLLTLRAPSDSAVDRVIQACNVLISIPKKHYDADAMLLAFRSRLELLAGQPVSAVESLDGARRLVPARLLDWFDNKMAVHIAALK